MGHAAHDADVHGHVQRNADCYKTRTTDMAAFATPELHQLFAEWLETMEGEALQHLKETGEADAEALAKALNISEESTANLVARMISSGKVDAQLRPSKSET